MKRNASIKTLIRIWPVALLSLCFLLPGSADKTRLHEDIAQSSNPLRGRNVLVSKGCTQCHATWGVGGKVAPDLTRIGMNKSVLQIAGALWNHAPRMIEQLEEQGGTLPALSPEEMSDFLDYLTCVNYVNQPGDPARGRQLFTEKGCIGCHELKNDNGHEVSPFDRQRYASTVLVAQAMWNHVPQMTEIMKANRIAQPSLQGREAADLFAFIRGQTADEIPGDKFFLPGSPAAGRRLFVEKGCAVCHTRNANGQTAAPDLAKTSAHQNITEIAAAMWNHSARIGDRMQQAGITRPTFSGNQMADIVAYLYFLRYADEAGNADAGRQLFTRQGCIQCHTPQALSAATALDSPVHLLAAMWNHAPRMQQQAHNAGLPWPTFQKNEMRDLIEYVKSSARPANETPR